MNYVLFIMFLISPPGLKEPDWTLQSTTTMDFANFEACDAAFQKILDSIKKTPTIAVSGWCFDKSNSKQPNVAGAPQAGPSTRTLPKGDVLPSLPPARLLRRPPES
jgi:hypothetical protein